jgi:hypothetical protein
LDRQTSWSAPSKHHARWSTEIGPVSQASSLFPVRWNLQGLLGKVSSSPGITFLVYWSTRVGIRTTLVYMQQDGVRQWHGPKRKTSESLPIDHCWLFVALPPMRVHVKSQGAGRVNKLVKVLHATLDPIIDLPPRFVCPWVGQWGLEI